MLQFFKNNTIFYTVYLITVVFTSYFILTTSQLELHLKINQCVGNVYVNGFLKYITHLGDGLFLILIALIFLFFDVKKSIILLLCYAISGGFTQFLKEAFFNFEMRPFFYHSFHDFPLKIVEGVDMHSQNSFPSGHATAAFCLFTFLSFYTKENILKFSLINLAIVIAFSRVYLSQHFIEDITVGSLIGTGFTTLFLYLIYYTKFLNKLDQLEKPVYQFFKK
jgi:membrane-associated phospholipid phosphatase